MTRSPAHVTLPCPAVFWGEYRCAGTLHVIAYPYIPRRIALDPDDCDEGESAYLEIGGCYHAETLTMGEEEDIWITIAEREQQARDTAIEARISEALGK